MSFESYSRPASAVTTLNFAIKPEVLLEQQKMMAYASYRRLCNIVESHKFNPATAFRNNLIKQLYFLLQMAPIIQDQLIDRFLGKIEGWYDSNDHKKIKLASKALSKKLKDNHIQPKQRYTETISIQNNFWNLQKSKFAANNNQSPTQSGFRPLTAKLNSASRSANRFRPLSSNKPITSNKVQPSTQVDSEDRTSNFQENQFTVNLYEEMQRSQDFVKKHRTIHPEQEPFHQQLHKLFNGAMPEQFKENCESRTDYRQIIRSDQKAATYKLQSQAAVERPLTQQFLQMQAFAQDLSEDFSSENNDHELSNLLCEDDNKKLFTIDRPKTGNPRKSNDVIRERPLTGFCRLANLSKDEMNLMERLDKMTAQVEHAKQKFNIEGDQILIQSLEYLKNKERITREINRKNESVRMNIFQRKIRSAGLKPKPFDEIIREARDQDKQNQSNIIDISIGEIKSLQKPTYNQRRILSPKYNYEIDKFRKFKRHLGVDSRQEAKPSAFPRPYNSVGHTKYDVLNYKNVQTHNLQVLDEITKIKEKVDGKAYLSSKALMKALYIDSYDQLYNKENISISERHERNGEKFQPINKKYLMVSNPLLKTKKKKKKRTHVRKLKK